MRLPAMIGSAHYILSFGSHELVAAVLSAHDECTDPFELILIGHQSRWLPGCF